MAPAPRGLPGPRLFVAVDVPDATARDIRDALAGSGFNCRRFPERLHLTLSFLGNVPGDLLPGLCDALAGAATEPAFELRLGALGTFRRGTGTVLWAGLEPSGGLSSLKFKVDRAMAPLGLAPKDGPGVFTPHLTLARLKPRDPQPPRGISLVRPGGSFTVEAFGLFSSELRPDGAVHKLVKGYRLPSPDEPEP
jgi:2'-5' RNA ligase